MYLEVFIDAIPTQIGRFNTIGNSFSKTFYQTHGINKLPHHLGTAAPVIDPAAPATRASIVHYCVRRGLTTLEPPGVPVIILRDEMRRVVFLLFDPVADWFYFRVYFVT